MKTNPLKLAALASLPAVLLAFTSRSAPSGDEEVVALETADGAAIVDTLQTTATMTAIDATTRKATLALRDGSTKTVKVGKQVNLSSAKPGEDVTVWLTEAPAITVESSQASRTRRIHREEVPTAEV